MMNDTMNQKEKIFGFIYVFLLFISIAAVCSWLIFSYNPDFRLLSQKDFAISKMNMIKDYQNEQNAYIYTMDSVYNKIQRFNPGVNAVYEENEILYMINDLKNVYESRSWDTRYKSFLHVSDFYYMWFIDKKELWSKRNNISRFRKNLEECEIGLNNKRQDINSLRR
ncbi:MAG TPA: hypothetical protein DIT04_08810 [Dysgonomonas sp.]|nr:hypothetical protein [Dysgonomonas sp.]